MEKAKFIYQIESEKHFTCLTRIVNTFSRRRIHIVEIHSYMREGEDRQRLTISIFETKDSAVKISKKLEMEIDILSINLFEYANHN